MLKSRHISGGISLSQRIKGYLFGARQTLTGEVFIHDVRFAALAAYVKPIKLQH